MEKEFGKWLMDIAKYMVTGLYWVNKGEQNEKKKGKKK